MILPVCNNAFAGAALAILTPLPKRGRDLLFLASKSRRQLAFPPLLWVRMNLVYPDHNPGPTRALCRLDISYGRCS